MKLEELVYQLKQKEGIEVNITRVKERLQSEFGVTDLENIPDDVASNFKGKRISLGAYARIHERSRSTILMYRYSFKSYREDDNKLLDIETYWTCNSQALLEAFDRIGNHAKYAKLREKLINKATEENEGIEKTIFRALNEYVAH